MDVKSSLFTLIFFIISIFCIQSSFQKNLDPKYYFYKFGYLTSMDYVDDYVFETATKKYQKSFGLPQTGRLDQETKAKMALPRCGMLEKSRNTVRQGSENTWKTRFLTYKIRNSTQFFPENQMKKVMEKAIRLWTQNTELKITESLSNSTNINVYFSEIDDDDVLGYAYPPETGDIYLADIEDLSPTSSSKMADWLFAHELGHALGLDHATSTDSIMYPAYEDPVTLVPSMVDKNNLVALYGGQAGLNKELFCQKVQTDALMSINDNHIAIKGEHYWTFTKQGLLGGPFFLNELFPFEEGVPGRVDAGFDNGNASFLFMGDVYYKFRKRKFHYKKRIWSGFNRLPSYIDAAFYESGRKTVHFFKGSRYYRLSEKKLAIAYISDFWKGIPDDLDAASMIEEKRVLFVKENKCYIVDIDSYMVVQVQDCAKDFFKCN